MVSPQRPQGGEALEEPSYVFLEDHHQCDDEHGEKTLEHQRGEVEVKKPCTDVYPSQQAHSNEHEPGSGMLEPDEDDVDECCDDEYIKEILKPEALEKGKNGVIHEKMLSPRMPTLQQYKKPEPVSLQQLYP